MLRVGEVGHPEGSEHLGWQGQGEWPVLVSWALLSVQLTSGLS